LWQAADEGRFDGCIASFTIPSIYYICRKQQSAEAALSAVDICMEAFEVAALYRECVLAARRMSGPDFEDNLQIACAITDFMQGIVTRNPRDFASSPIRVYTPGELLAALKL
jgi:predicted nucleic acid-binding protein